MRHKITAMEIEDHDKAAKRNDFDVAGIFIEEGGARIQGILASAKIMGKIGLQAGLIAH